MAKPIIYLNFKDRADIGDNGRIKLLTIPNGFQAADFALICDTGRMGVDKVFAGGTASFEFSRMSNPEVFEILQSVILTDGYDSIVDMEIDYSGNGEIIIIGNLDLPNSDNNVFSLLTSDVVLGEDQTKIKKNIEANNDLFASIGVLGEVIQPVPTSNIYLKSKPVFSTSVWESPDGAFTFSQGGSLNNPPFFNRVKNLTVNGIDDSLTWMDDYVDQNNNALRSNFRVLKAATTLTNVKVRIDKNLRSEWSAQPPFNNNIQIKGKIFVGTPETWYQDFTNTNNVFYDVAIGETMPFKEDNGVYEVNLGNIDTGKVVFFVFYHGSQGNDIAKTIYGNTKLTITASAINYDTVNKGIRLIDAIKYLAKSSGNANVSFPEAEIGGWLYDQFLFNGNLLRNITDKPFYLQFKEINEWFPELHLDYEIQNDGNIFIGNDKAFYANRELYVTDKIVFDIFKRNLNPEFKINLYEFGFDGFQSQKENDVANTYDGVHAEAQWKSPNSAYKDTKSAKVGFIRDPFALEQTRVKAFQKDDNAATQDDDKKYIVDVFPSSRLPYQQITQTKTDFLQHSFDAVNQRLTLRNTGNFNWSLLGITIGQSFRITSVPTQPNQGTYTVVEVSSNYIIIAPVGNITITNNIERYTNFQYFIPVSSIAGITWTNEDFSLIEGVQNPESFGNLRFSVGRNKEHWSSHLASSTLGKNKNKPFRNIQYKNNPNLITTLNGITIKEGDDFVAKNPLLNEVLYTVVFQMKFNEYYNLIQNIRSSNRGFIRTFDVNLNPLKLYVKDMRFKANAGTLGTVTLIGKEKYEPSIVNIDNNRPNFIELNYGEYQVQKIIYELKNNYFYIKDQNGKLMYNKLGYNQISINGTQALNKTQLINWLNIIT